MKKSISFYLEEDVFDEIEKYKVENNLQNRSTALERMVFEYKALQKELEYTKVLANYAKDIMQNGKITHAIQEDSKQKETPKKENGNSGIRRSLKNSYENME